MLIYHWKIAKTLLRKFAQIFDTNTVHDGRLCCPNSRPEDADQTNAFHSWIKIMSKGWQAWFLIIREALCNLSLHAVRIDCSENVKLYICYTIEILVTFFHPRLLLTSILVTRGIGSWRQSPTRVRACTVSYSPSCHPTPRLVHLLGWVSDVLIRIDSFGMKSYITELTITAGTRHPDVWIKNNNEFWLVQLFFK
jgi:hypothetical protein